ncbi:MAG TPA: cyclic nucleotide-binding domain-containing protein [Anaerolineales bacterium]|jgi:CRP-like cAMP-binding protein|nr:cyclic nucleotide-binding domain-containing protein [Anaerolineales bacterium]
MLNSFFDYPDQEDGQPSAELVFLPHWDDGKWEKLLRYTEIRRFRTGDIVIRQGDTDRAFYIIVEGRLEVLIPRGNSGQMRRTQLRESGAVVGEQAFLDGKPRSATLRAVSDGEALSISLQNFEVFAAHEPELAREVLLDLARTLSVKLRQANAFITNWIK